MNQISCKLISLNFQTFRQLSPLVKVLKASITSTCTSSLILVLFAIIALRWLEFVLTTLHSSGVLARAQSTNFLCFWLSTILAPWWIYNGFSVCLIFSLLPWTYLFWGSPWSFVARRQIRKSLTLVKHIHCLVFTRLQYLGDQCSWWSHTWCLVLKVSSKGLIESTLLWHLLVLLIIWILPSEADKFLADYLRLVVNWNWISLKILKYLGIQT